MFLVYYQEQLGGGSCD